MGAGEFQSLSQLSNRSILFPIRLGEGHWKSASSRRRRDLAGLHIFIKTQRTQELGSWWLGTRDRTGTRAQLGFRSC